MNEVSRTNASNAPGVRVNAGEDRFGEHHGLGISAIDFKVAAQDSSDLFVLENKFQEKGGPALHLHHTQDEWFFVLEGAFLMQVGQEKTVLHVGDSLLAPRNVPHVFAHVGDGVGRILIAFAPAGQMEAFFREVTQSNAMPMQDPTLWRAYGMELLGPPMSLA